MGVLKIPKTIRWVSFCALLLLVLLTLYRITIYLFFRDLFTGAGSQPGAAFWYGFRFDARIVGIITLMMLLLSFWPGLHFFKWAGGRLTALIVYGLCAAFVLFFCIADIIYLRSFNMRLQGSLISDLAKGTDKWSLYQQAPYWWLLFICIAVIVFTFVVLIKAAHKVINKSRSRDAGGLRIFWQILAFLLCTLAIYGRLAPAPLTVAHAAKKLTEEKLQLALNPFESLFSTLPEKR